MMEAVLLVLTLSTFRVCDTMVMVSVKMPWSWSPCSRSRPTSEVSFLHEGRSTVSASTPDKNFAESDPITFRKRKTVLLIVRALILISILGLKLQNLVIEFRVGINVLFRLLEF